MCQLRAVLFWVWCAVTAGGASQHAYLVLSVCHNSSSDTELQDRTGVVPELLSVVWVAAVHASCTAGRQLQLHLLLDVRRHRLHS